MQINRNQMIGASAALAVVAFFLIAPPIVQDQNYHLFADSRTIWGIPNFWNVISNIPFVLVGILGLCKLRSTADRMLFAGVLLTCFGSSYYHLAPSDARLVWDRLPMTIVFMSILACVLTKECDSRSRRWAVGILVTCGIASVAWWRFTGDLRPYVLVQFGSLLILIASLLFVRNAGFLVAVAVLYALAKVFELGDRAVYAVAPISGHSVKHVLAALAMYFLYLWRVSIATSALPRAEALTPEPAHN